MLYKNEKWYYRINRKGPMEMQSHSWKREFVSLLTSNSTWICALIFPARLPSVSPGLEEWLGQAGGRCAESSVSTAAEPRPQGSAGLSPAVPCCLPSSGASSPTGCHHHPLCSAELPFLVSHPGSVLQSRESSGPSLPEDGEQPAHYRGSLPGRHRQEGTQPS